MRVSKHVLIELSDRLSLGYDFLEKFDLSQSDFDKVSVIKNLRSNYDVLYLAFILKKIDGIVEFCRQGALYSSTFINPETCDIDLNLFNRYINKERNLDFIKLLNQAKLIEFTDVNIDGKSPKDKHILALLVLKIYTLVDFYYNSSLIYRDEEYKFPFMKEYPSDFCVESANDLFNLCLIISEFDRNLTKLFSIIIWQIFQDVS